MNTLVTTLRQKTGSMLEDQLGKSRKSISKGHQMTNAEIADIVAEDFGFDISSRKQVAPKLFDEIDPQG